MSDPNTYDTLVKILMVGESGVGKTCLIRRFIKKDFVLNHLSTIAIDFKRQNVQLDGKTISLQLWDTAGQERFNTLTSAFFKGSDGIAICYSVTDRRSFENIQKWISKINDQAPENVKIVIIGNKNDMVGEREITYEEGEQMASQFNADFFETSAKSGENVETVFMTMTRKIVDDMKDKGFDGSGGEKIVDKKKNFKEKCCKN